MLNFDTDVNKNDLAHQCENRLNRTRPMNLSIQTREALTGLSWA